MSRTLTLLAVVALAGCGGGENAKGPLPPAPARIKLVSPAFPAGAAIPRRFTCDGEDASPPLRWYGVPRRARELALVVQDPDAPGGTFIHWTVLGIPPTTKRFPEGHVPAGAIEGKNSFDRQGYTGPCPPKGPPHRYMFFLYAVSRPLALQPGVSPSKVRSALRGVAIARGELTGRYGR
jgi:Raf kinase inhibitor-like YbhB/YbcL family protein